MGTPLEAPFQLFNQLNAYNKTYIVHCNQTVTEGRNIANALDILMISATKLAYSEKLVMLRQVQTLCRSKAVVQTVGA